MQVKKQRLTQGNIGPCLAAFFTFLQVDVAVHQPGLIAFRQCYAQESLHVLSVGQFRQGDRQGDQFRLGSPAQQVHEKYRLYLDQENTSPASVIP